MTLASWTCGPPIASYRGYLLPLGSVEESQVAEGVEEHEQKKEEKVVNRAAQKVRQYIEFENIPIRTM